MSMIGPASRRGDKVVGRLQAEISAAEFFSKAWKQPETQRNELGSGMNRKTASELVSQVGLAGKLPKEMTREQKKAAYEARWVASGGKQKQKHQRRADVASALTTGALAGGGASAGIELAARTERGNRLLNARNPNLARRIRAGSAKGGLASAALGASAELYRRRQSDKARRYSSAPGGVAAGALRRMQDYDSAKGN